MGMLVYSLDCCYLKHYMYAYKLGRIIMNSLKPLLHICNKTIASTQPENSICCMFRYHVLVSSWVTVSVAMSTAWLQK